MGDTVRPQFVHVRDLSEADAALVRGLAEAEMELGVIDRAIFCRRPDGATGANHDTRQRIRRLAASLNALADDHADATEASS